MQSEWIGAISGLNPAPEERMADWMLKTGNLGGALRSVWRILNLRLLAQDFGLSLADEAKALGLNQDQACFVRRIFLEGDGVPLTFGRVVVPEAVYKNHAEGFGSLGTKLIGEALLYRSASTVRSAFEFKNIGPVHPVYAFLRRHLPADYSFPALFPARRSVFFLGGSEPLLIMEVFLSGLLGTAPAAVLGEPKAD